MADQRQQNTPPQAQAAASVASAPPADMAQAMTLIAQLLAKQTELTEYQIKNAPKAKKTMAQYLKDNPRKRLLREVYQAQRPVNPRGLSQDTINLLDTLAAGSYADGMVEIKRLDDGDKRFSRIHILYNNRTPEQKMVFYMKFPTFTTLVKTVAAEMAARGTAPVMDPVAEPIEEEIPELR